MGDSIKEIATAVSGLLVPLIALFAAYIAYQQYQAAKLKLKMDLFERRFALFETVFDFICHVAAGQKVTAADVIKLDEAKLVSFFVFHGEVPKYIQTVREKAESVTVLNSQAEQIAKLGGSDALTQKRQTQDAEVAWFAEQREKCRNVFEPYLAIRP